LTATCPVAIFDTSALCAALRLGLGAAFWSRPGQKLEDQLSSSPVVRVSILRTDADRFSRVRDEMTAALDILAPGIRALTGHIDFFAGADEATFALTNVSLWRSLADAHQLDHFQPMLDLAPRFAALGATFERPIINAATLWRTAPAEQAG
jgi:hypothetical protein